MFVDRLGRRFVPSPIAARLVFDLNDPKYRIKKMSWDIWASGTEGHGARPTTIDRSRGKHIFLTFDTLAHLFIMWPREGQQMIYLIYPVQFLCVYMSIKKIETCEWSSPSTYLAYIHCAGGKSNGTGESSMDLVNTFLLFSFQSFTIRGHRHLRISPPPQTKPLDSLANTIWTRSIGRQWCRQQRSGVYDTHTEWKYEKRLHLIMLFLFSHASSLIWWKNICCYSGRLRTPSILCCVVRTRY